MQKISHTQLAGMFQRMAVSYAAGIEIRKILRRETETGSSTYRQNIQGIAKKVDQGESLGKSMAETDGYFPQLSVAVVQAGEKGGRLEESFGRLAAHYRSLSDFRKQFIGLIWWPCLQLFASIAIVGAMILILDFVYRLGDMQPIDWFGMGSTTGNFILYWTVIGLIFGGLYVLYRGTTKGWLGLLPNRIARRIPLIGKTIEHLALSRFAWTMSVCENAGMGAIETIKLALSSSEDYYYKQLEPELTNDIQRGDDYYTALQATECFPEDLLIYVDNGETAGELAESMNRASIELQERAATNLKAIAAIGGVLVFGLVAVIIGGTVILMFQNLYLKPLQEFM